MAVGANVTGREGGTYHALDALAHGAEALLVVGTTPAHVDLDLVHPEALLEVPDGLDDTLERFRHVGEVGNTTANDEHLVPKRKTARVSTERVHAVSELMNEASTLPPWIGSPLVMRERIVLAYSKVSDSVGSPEYSP